MNSRPNRGNHNHRFTYESEEEFQSKNLYIPAQRSKSRKEYPSEERGFINEGK